jgi:hypothetical protein
MPITKAISSKANVKQKSSADLPFSPATVVTNKYGPATSIDGQTVISLGFAVDQANKNNFFLAIDGRILSEGALNDYTFINVQPNNTSSQVQLNVALIGGMNLQAWNLGLIQPSLSSTSITTLQAQVNQNSAAIPKNYLLNSDFLFWQRGTSGTISNGSTAYQADRWYAKNALGTNGVLTYSQVAGSVTGSKYGAQLQITTAPTAAQANGTELYQVIENMQTLELLGNSISFAAQIKALGNVNQIGIQFLYATTEVKPSTALGSEQLVTVNSSGFTLAQVINQAVGALPTTSGVVGVRIRITGVSSGNLYDLNNGFVVEQATMNAGSTAATWRRASQNIGNELAACQRFTEAFIVPAGTFAPSNGSAIRIAWNFKVTKRAVPTVSGTITTSGSSPSFLNASAQSVLVNASSASTGSFDISDGLADAEI